MQEEQKEGSEHLTTLINQKNCFLLEKRNEYNTRQVKQQTLAFFGTLCVEFLTTLRKQKNCFLLKRTKYNARPSETAYIGSFEFSLKNIDLVGRHSRDPKEP